MPIQEVSKLGISDKLEHFAAYAVLAGLLPFLREKQRARQLLVACVGLVVIGAVLEVAQGLVPTRRPDVHDAWANTSGVLLGAVAGELVRRFGAPRRPCREFSSARGGNSRTSLWRHNK